MNDQQDKEQVEAGADESRRHVLGGVTSIAMFGGLAAAYGTLAGFAGRFLFPPRDATKGWMFVTEVARLPPGEAVVFRTPSGQPINIARQGEGTGQEDFVALSSTCPHLGCQVHWEGHNNRFFCPCHNGVFDPSGVATEGPPAEAGQSLLRFPLKIESGLVYVEVSLDEIAQGEGTIEPNEAHGGPGHDPCLLPVVRRA